MKLLREPLLHFLIAGCLLFAGYGWLNRGAQVSQSEGPVRIGDGEIRWLQETFANQWRRTPTPEEMNNLVSRLLEEELLAREARALKLDQSDTIVRRRLAQKLTFLVEDTSRIAEPDENELRRFYVDHAGQYQTEPRVSFTHIYFSPKRSQAEADARAALAVVSLVSRDQQAPQGDRLLLEDTYADVDQQAVTSLFGLDFAHAIFALTPGAWSGPVRSAFGVHLVRVTGLRPAELPRFDGVRERVLDDWRHERESHLKAAYLARLRDKYGVVFVESAKPFSPDARATP